MSSSQQYHEILYNFFRGGNYDIFMNKSSIDYIRNIIIKNKNEKYIEISNDMKDLGDRDEIGNIVVKNLQNLNNYNLNDNEILKFNYSFEFDELSNIKDVFIEFKSKKYRTGFFLEFERDKLLFIPSVFPYCIHAVGVNGYIDFHDSEFSIEEYSFEK